MTAAPTRRVTTIPRISEPTAAPITAEEDPSSLHVHVYVLTSEISRMDYSVLILVHTINILCFINSHV